MSKNLSYCKLYTNFAVVFNKHKKIVMKTTNVNTNDKYVKRIGVKTTKHNGLKLTYKYVIRLTIDDFC